jgi:hypothetical protein
MVKVRGACLSFTWRKRFFFWMFQIESKIKLVNKIHQNCFNVYLFFHWKWNKLKLFILPIENCTTTFPAVDRKRILHISFPKRVFCGFNHGRMIALHLNTINLRYFFFKYRKFFTKIKMVQIKSAEFLVGFNILYHFLLECKTYCEILRKYTYIYIYMYNHITGEILLLL